MSSTYINSIISTSGTINFVNTTVSTSSTNGSVVFAGGIGISKELNVAKSFNISSSISGTPSLFGPYLNISSSVFTDNNTANSGTASSMVFHSITAPTLAATNTSITTTNAATFYISGSPIAGTNQTITNSYGFWNSSNSRIDGLLVSTNSTNSTNSTTGSFLLSGSLAISNTTDSSSSTNGGTITTAGGISIAKKLFVGDYISSDSTNSSSAASGTGALRLLGGLSINNTTDSVSFTNGGTITTAGGAAFAKKVYIGDLATVRTLTINANNSSSGSPSITGAFMSILANTFTDNNTAASGTASVMVFNSIATPTLIATNTTVTTTNAANLYIAGNPIAGTNQTLTNSYGLWNVGNERIDGIITSTNTTASTSNTTGSLLLSGSLAINKTTDAISSTNGGTITTAGGVAIAKKLFVGTDLSIGGNITSGTWNGTAITVSFGGTGQTTLNSNAVLLGNGTSSIQSPTTITYSSSTLTLPKITSNDTTASTSSTLGAVLLSGGLGINNTTDATSTTNGGALTIAGGVAINKKLFIGSDVSIVGNITSGTWNGSSITVPYGGTGAITFNANSILVGNSNSAIQAYTNLTYNNSTSILSVPKITSSDTTASTSSTLGAVLLSGGLSISNTTNAVSSTNGGTITTAGGAAITKDLYIGGDIYITGALSFGTFGSGTIPVSNGGTGQTTLNSNAVLLGNGTSPIQSPTTITYSSSTLTLPKITSNDTTATTSNTTGAILLSGGLAISNTTDATSSTNGGTITTAGGAAIAKNLYVGGTTTTTSTTTGALVITGGLAIGTTTEATSSSNGGCLTIAGGAALPRRIFTGSTRSGAGNIIGVNIIQNSHTYTDNTTAQDVTIAIWAFNALRTPTLAATNTNITYNNVANLYIEAGPVFGTNINTTNSYGLWNGGATRLDGQLRVLSSTATTSNSTGAFLLSGGLAISNTTDSVSFTNGGTITSAGGAAFAKRVYIGDLATVRTLFVNSSGSQTGTPSTTGSFMSVAANTFTDSATAASGTAATATFISFATPTLAATNTGVTTTNAANVYIAGGPIAGTNETLTNSYGLWNVGNTRIDGTSLFNNTTTSTSSTTGAVRLTGGLAISNTTDASSSTNGGTITTAGGLAVAKAAYIGTSLTVNSRNILTTLDGQPFLNIKTHFGVLGDGSDEGTLLNSVLQSNFYVYFPPGTYYSSTTISVTSMTSGVWLLNPATEIRFAVNFQGASSSTSKFLLLGNNALWRHTTNAVFTIFVTNLFLQVIVKDVIFSGVAYDSVPIADTKTALGINLTNTNSTFIGENVKSYEFNKLGYIRSFVIAPNSIEVYLNNCVGQRNTYSSNGTLLNINPEAYNNSPRYSINKYSLLNSHLEVLNYTPRTTGNTTSMCCEPREVQRVSVDNCKFIDGFYGISGGSGDAGSMISVKNCSFFNQVNCAIENDWEECNVIGNKFEDIYNGLTSPTAGWQYGNAVFQDSANGYLFFNSNYTIGLQNVIWIHDTATNIQINNNILLDSITNIIVGVGLITTRTYFSNYSNNSITLLNTIEDDISITSTNASTASSGIGALRVSGGVSISNTTDSSSSTNGGTITTAGGVAIAKSLYVGGSIASFAQGLNISSSLSGTPATTGPYLKIGSSTFTDNNTASSGTAASMVFNSIATPTLAATNTTVTTTNAATVYIAGGPTAGTNQTLTNSYGLWNVGNTRLDGTALFNNTTASTSNTTGAIRLTGGLGISNTTEATSSTNGGTITTAGGVAIAKKLFVGTDLSIGGNITSGVWNGTAITVPYGGTGQTTLNSNAVLLGNGTGAIQNPTTITFSSSTLTLPKIISNDTTASTSNTTGAVLLSGGLGLSNTTDATSSTNGGTITTAGGVAIAKKLFVGTDLSIGGNITSGVWNGTAITVPYGGTGQTTLNSNAVLLGNGTGAIQNPTTITFSSSTLTLPKITSNDTTATTSNTTGAVLLSGGLGLSNTTDATSSTNGGTITTAGGVAIAKKLFVGTDLTTSSTSNLFINNISSTSGTNILNFITTGTIATSRIYLNSASNTTQYSNQFFLFGLGTPGATDTEAFRIAIGATDVSFSNTKSGTGANKSLSFYAGNTTGQLTLNTNNTISCNDTTSTTSSTTGALALSGGLAISKTTDASSSTNGGTITTAGGVAIAKSLYVGGSIASFAQGLNISSSLSGTPATTGPYLRIGASTFTDNNTAAAGTAASMVFNSIATPTLAATNTTVTTTNAATVYIAGGPTAGTNQTLTNSYGFWNVGNTRHDGIITTTNTTASTSNTTGSLLLAGSIGISNTTDSSSSLNGGSITTAGGVAIAKNLHVGGSIILRTTAGITLFQVSQTSNNPTVAIGSSSTSTVVTRHTASTTSSQSIFFNDTTVDQGAIIYNHNSNFMQFTVETVNAMRINAANINMSYTASSTSNTTGALTLAGSIGISNTTDASSSTNGGTITTAGGVAIAKNLFVGGAAGISIESVLGNRALSIQNGGSLRFAFGIAGTESGSNVGGNLNLNTYDDTGVFIATAATITRSNSTLTINGTTTSTSNTTGGLVLSGGLGISNTTEATSSTNGGAATIAGGVAIAKSLYVSTVLNVDAATSKVNVNNIDITPSSGDLNEKSFSANNNQASAANITNFIFSNSNVRSFKAYVSLTLIATSNLYQHLEIFGLQKASGSWTIQLINILGDTGLADNGNILFTINSSGQIQYTTTTFAGFTSLTIKFRSITTSV